MKNELYYGFFDVASEKSHLKCLNRLMGCILSVCKEVFFRNVN